MKNQSAASHHKTRAEATHKNLTNGYGSRCQRSSARCRSTLSRKKKPLAALTNGSLWLPGRKARQSQSSFNRRNASLSRRSLFQTQTKVTTQRLTRLTLHRAFRLPRGGTQRTSTDKSRIRMRILAASTRRLGSKTSFRFHQECKR